MGLYLTVLLTIERFFTKIFSRFFFQSIVHYRRLGRRVFISMIYLFIVLISSIRLYQVLSLIRRNPPASASAEDYPDTLADIIDTAKNSSDRNISFTHCFQSMNIDSYAKVLSFYVLQEWYEYVSIVGIIIFLLIFLLYHCCLSRLERTPTSRSFSINTKLYLILASCVAVSEVILVFFHLIVDDVNNNNTDVQLTSLQFMLFAFNFRTIVLPLMVCFFLSDPLKAFLRDLLFVRPYLENIDDTDQNNEQLDPFSSPQRTSHRRFREKLRRPFARDNSEDSSGNLWTDSTDCQRSFLIGIKHSSTLPDREQFLLFLHWTWAWEIKWQRNEILPCKYHVQAHAVRWKILSFFSELRRIGFVILVHRLMNHTWDAGRNKAKSRLSFGLDWSRPGCPLKGKTHPGSLTSDWRHRLHASNPSQPTRLNKEIRKEDNNQKGEMLLYGIPK